MTETEKPRGPTLATVRLMPSIATEPFSTTKRMISGEASRVMMRAMPSLVRDATVPVPSMCPVTMWPPRRPEASRARSRLTGVPAESEPSAERLSVSGMTSARNAPPRTAFTVRQTPFTAMLSPVRVPSKTVWARTSSSADWAAFLTAPSVPTSSMIPVNKRSSPTDAPRIGPTAKPNPSHFTHQF